MAYGSRSVTNIYTQYLAWYDQIPEELQLGHNYTPAVLFLYMYHHFALLLLFTPLMRLRMIDSEIVPHDICRQAADALQGILLSYSELYSLCRTPTFVPYFAVNSTIIHLALSLYDTPSGHSTAISDTLDVQSPKLSQIYSNQRSVSNDAQLSTSMGEAINKGIANLLQMKHCHHSAAQAFQTVCYFANKWQLKVNIAWPKTVFDESANKSHEPTISSLNSFSTDVKEEEFICACGAQTHGTRPGTGIQVGGAVPANDVEKNIQKQVGRTMTVAETMSRIDGAAWGIENPHFWPFPMQTRPIFLNGPLLTKAGFTLA